jgi:predicted PhzF superfamily epimerase YddE/YHI9
LFPLNFISIQTENSRTGRKNVSIAWFLPLRPSTQTATCFKKAIIQEIGLEPDKILKEPIQIVNSNIHRETIKRNKNPIFK